MGRDVVIEGTVKPAVKLAASTEVVVVHHTGGGLYSEHWVHLRPVMTAEAYELASLRPAEAEQLGQLLSSAAARCRSLDALTQPPQVRNPLAQAIENA